MKFCNALDRAISSEVHHTKQNISESICRSCHRFRKSRRSLTHPLTPASIQHVLEVLALRQTRYCCSTHPAWSANSARGDIVSANCLGHVASPILYADCLGRVLNAPTVAAMRNSFVCWPGDHGPGNSGSSGSLCCQLLALEGMHL